MAARIYTEIEATQGNEHEQVARDVRPGHLSFTAKQANNKNNKASPYEAIL